MLFKVTEPADVSSELPALDVAVEPAISKPRLLV
jgi:hypothetical protein